jgi:hypothetical protein
MLCKAGKGSATGKYHPLPAPALGMSFELISEVAADVRYAVTDLGRLAKEQESGKLQAHVVVSRAGWCSAPDPRSGA